MDSLNSPFYMDDELLSRIKDFALKRIAIHSDNDPFIPQSKLKEFVNLINADEYVLANGGHINKSAGIVEFDLLLDLIKKITNK